MPLDMTKFILERPPLEVFISNSLHSTALKLFLQLNLAYMLLDQLSIDFIRPLLVWTKRPLVWALYALIHFPHTQSPLFNCQAQIFLL